MDKGSCWVVILGRCPPKIIYPPKTRPKTRDPPQFLFFPKPAWLLQCVPAPVRPASATATQGTPAWRLYLIPSPELCLLYMNGSPVGRVAGEWFPDAGATPLHTTDTHFFVFVGKCAALRLWGQCAVSRPRLLAAFPQRMSITCASFGEHAPYAAVGVVCCSH